MYESHAILKYCFSIQLPSSDIDSIPQSYMVMILPANSIQLAVNELKILADKEIEIQSQKQTNQNKKNKK
jgi:hypothetical protein